MRAMIRCPICKSPIVYLSTPDYGYGYGIEFTCYAHGEHRFAVKSEEAKALSDASLARSAQAAKESGEGMDG